MAQVWIDTDPNTATGEGRALVWCAQQVLAALGQPPTENLASPASSAEENLPGPASSGRSPADAVVEIDVTDSQDCIAAAVERSRRVLAEAEAKLANVRTYCEGVRSYCSAERIDPPPWVTNILDSIGCLASQPPAEKETQDPTSRRDLLRELTQAAVDAGSYDEPAPPKEDPNV